MEIVSLGPVSEYHTVNDGTSAYRGRCPYIGDDGTCVYTVRAVICLHRVGDATCLHTMGNGTSLHIAGDVTCLLLVNVPQTLHFLSH